MPEDFNVALGGIKQAEQQLDRGRFAGAVRPEQAEHLAAADLKIHVIDSARLGAAPEILEDLGQPADGYNRLGGFEIGAGRLRGDLGGGHGINFQVWRPRERFPPNPLLFSSFLLRRSSPNTIPISRAVNTRHSMPEIPSPTPRPFFYCHQ